MQPVEDNKATNQAETEQDTKPEYNGPYAPQEFSIETLPSSNLHNNEHVVKRIKTLSVAAAVEVCQMTSDVELDQFELVVTNASYNDAARKASKGMTLYKRALRLSDKRVDNDPEKKETSYNLATIYFAESKNTASLIPIVIPYSHPEDYGTKILEKIYKDFASEFGYSPSKVISSVKKHTMRRREAFGAIATGLGIVSFATVMTLKSGRYLENEKQKWDRIEGVVFNLRESNPKRLPDIIKAYRSNDLSKDIRFLVEELQSNDRAVRIRALKAFTVLACVDASRFKPPTYYLIEPTTPKEEYEQMLSEVITNSRDLEFRKNIDTALKLIEETTNRKSFSYEKCNLDHIQP